MTDRLVETRKLKPTRKKWGQSMKTACLICLIGVVAISFPFSLNALEDEQESTAIEVFEPYAEHLQYFGYEVEIREGLLLATISDGHNLIFETGPWGVMSTTMYSNDSGKEYDAEFFKILNDINSKAGVTRSYVLEDGTLMIESVYFSEYERSRFATFLHQTQTELDSALDEWRGWAFAEREGD